MTVCGRDQRDFRQRACTENRGAIRFLNEFCCLLLLFVFFSRGATGGKTSRPGETGGACREDLRTSAAVLHIATMTIITIDIIIVTITTITIITTITSITPTTIITIICLVWLCFLLLFFVLRVAKRSRDRCVREWW